jgi:xylan 1,4-beta-xylosidase
MIAAVPELKDKPVVIGESDPDGCAACQGHTWAIATRPLFELHSRQLRPEAQLAARHVNLQGALTWAFGSRISLILLGFACWPATASICP